MDDNSRLNNGQELLSSLALIAVGLPLGALDALIATDLYRWFVQPLGLPPVGWLHMWGLLICFAMIRSLAASVKKKENRPQLGAIWMHRFSYLVLVLSFWGLGWVIVTVAS